MSRILLFKLKLHHNGVVVGVNKARIYVFKVADFNVV